MAWFRVASQGDIAPGEVKGVTVGETALAIYNVEGTFYATAGICTHAFAHLCEGYLDGHQIECPVHQGIFDVRTGAALEGPVEEDLQTYPVKLERDDVMVDV